MEDNKDYINKMYDSSLESQKAQLESDYKQNQANLDEQQKKTQTQTDANLNRTYTEAEKAWKNYNEVQNAYGLTSGAMAQARIAQDNQLQADLTALRAVQQEADSDVERQRNLLSQQYASAIAKAQADNDLQRAQALYQEAKDAEAALLQKQKEAASLMAGVGDFSLYQNLYGLTDDQLAKLNGASGGYGGDSASGGAETGNATGATSRKDEPDASPEGVTGDGYTNESFNKMVTGLDTMLRNGQQSAATDYVTRRANMLNDAQLEQIMALFSKYRVSMP